MFLAKDSVRKTSAITAVTKSSKNEWHGATTNHHLHSYGNRRCKKGKGNTTMHTL